MNRLTEWAQRWLERHTKVKVIAGECAEKLGPLMIRYKLRETARYGIFVHHLNRSDIERDNHDHPWAFVAFLFGGSYIEHTPEGAFHRRRFSILFRPAEWIHRLELSRPVWTLVIVGKTKRDWGFWTPTGWISWRNYKYFTKDEC